MGWSTTNHTLRFKAGHHPCPLKSSRGCGKRMFHSPPPGCLTAMAQPALLPSFLTPTLLSLPFFLLCPPLHQLPCPPPSLSPTAQVSMSLTSWVTGALQLSGSLFGRTSQRCPGLWGQPTSHKVSCQCRRLT